MKIFILTMDEPVYTNPFIKKIIDERRDDIIGLAVSKGNRLTIGKDRSKVVYLLSLLLIMGFVHFTKDVFIAIKFKLLMKLSQIFRFVKAPSILEYAHSVGIETYKVRSVNQEDFLNILRDKKPDIVINQTQNIIKRELLDIPRKGVINRHNALLPKNRGRLSPFWVLYREEKETGVSIHFVNEGIDTGNVIVQERFPVSERDNITSIVRKNYEIAPRAMLRALDILETGSYKPIKNDDALTTYNTIPTFKEAIRFRLKRAKKQFFV